MTREDRDALFRKYLLCAHTGGTAEQRASAFQRWWKHEKADALQGKADEQRAEKRAQAEALR